MRCGLFRCLLLAALLGGCDASLTPTAGSDAGARSADAQAPIDAGGAAPADAEVIPEDDLEDDSEVPPEDAEEPPDPTEPFPEDEPEMMEMEAETGARTVRATYRVLHWNIAGGKIHGCRTAGITAAVRRYVNHHDIDFVGLNEVCPAQYRAIRDALRNLWGKAGTAKFSAFVGDGKPRVVGNAIFSRYNLEDVTRHAVGEDQYGTRNLLCARLRARPRLRFCSTHLSPGSAKARRQLSRVHDRIERWWANRRDTVILTGDFNLRPNDASFNAVYSRHANHPRNNPNNRGHYRELDDDDGAHCRGYGERTVPSTGGGPCGAGGKIDFIFVRQNRIQDRRYAADAMNIPNTCGGRCSDHRALRGRVRVLVRVD